MKYATELVDGFPTVLGRIENGQTSFKAIIGFMSEYSKLEKAHAKKLEKLVAKTRKAKGGMNAEVETTLASWDALLAELSKVAGAYNAVADSLTKSCIANIKAFEKEFAKDVKDLASAGSKLQSEADGQLKKLQKAQNKAQSAQAAALAAQGAAAQDDKLRPKADKAQEKSTSAWTEYNATYAEAHRVCTDYYATGMPRLLDGAQTLDIKRVANVRNALLAAIDALADVVPIAEGMVTNARGAATALDPAADINAFIQANAREPACTTSLEVPPFDATGSDGVTIYPPVGPNKHRSDSVSQPARAVAAPAAAPAGAGVSGGGTTRSPAPPPPAAAAAEESEPSTDSAAPSATPAAATGRTGSNTTTATGTAAATPPEPATHGQQMQVSGSHDDLGAIDADRLSLIITGVEDDNAEPEPYVALYDYTGQQEGDISFKTGDVIMVLGVDPDGWLRAEMDGVRGLAPSNFCRKMEPAEIEEMRK